MEFPGIKRLSASDEVFKTVHDWIVKKKLNPGDKLPSQDELAKQFKVSRNTLREAINKLTVMGLVSARQGVGTVVNITSAANYLSSLSDHLLMDKTTVTDFLEARMSVEMTTVKLAAIRAGKSDIDGLEQIFVKQAEAIRDVTEFSRLDAKFHLELAKASKNRVLVKILETLWDLLNRFIGEVSQLPGAVENAFGFHRRILDCIISSNPQQAEREVLDHLLDVTQTIKRHLDVEFEADSILEFASNQKRSVTGDMGRQGGTEQHEINTL